MKAVVYVNQVVVGLFSRIALWFGYHVIRVTVQSATEEVVLWKITKVADSEIFYKLTKLVGPVNPGWVRVTGIQPKSFSDTTHDLDAFDRQMGAVL